MALNNDDNFLTEKIIKYNIFFFIQGYTERELEIIVE